MGANPLLQNTIVQIDWLKDGRRLAAGNATRPTRLQIEKANHLHMPLAGQQQQQQLDRLSLATGAAEQSHQHEAARLLFASSLTISALAKTDAGAYSCQFKLIPAPSSAAGLQQVAGASQSAANSSLSGAMAFHFQQQQQQQQSARLIAGQSGQTIQLVVTEGKFRQASERRVAIISDVQVEKQRQPTTTTATTTATTTCRGGRATRFRAECQQFI